MRIEIGPKDIENDRVTVVMRDNGAKSTEQFSELEKISATFQEQFDRLYLAAKNDFISSLTIAKTWSEFMDHLNKGKMVLAPFHDNGENEEKLKDQSKKDSSNDSVLSGAAKSLNFPLDEELESLGLGIKNGEEMDCVTNELTGQKNKTREWCLFGRS